MSDNTFTFTSKSPKRTAEDIDRICEKLKAAWKKRAHERLCQLIVNITRVNDPFYVEDSVLESHIDRVRSGEYE